MTLAATFFGGINVAADTVGKQALDAQLANTPVDMQLRDFSVDGRKTLRPNETLINSDSQQAQNFPVGRRITYTLYTNSSTKYNVTLTIVGSVSLDTVAVNTLGIGYYYQPFPGNPGLTTANQQASILIVSWEQTFLPVLAKNYNSFSISG